VQIAANSTYHPEQHSWVDKCLKISMVLRCQRFWAKEINNYWRLLSLYLYSPYTVEHWIILLVFILCAYILFSFFKKRSWFWGGTHIADERIILKRCLCNCVNSAFYQSPYIYIYIQMCKTNTVHNLIWENSNRSYKEYNRPNLKRRGLELHT